MTMTYTQRVQVRNAEMPDLADYMTTEEAARALGFNVGSIRNMARRGIFETLRVGRSYLVSKKSVDEYKSRTFGMSPNDPRRRQAEN